jgi:glucuronate isomerase
MAADVEVKSFPDFIAALRSRHDYFHAMGCRLSDHGLETVSIEDYTDSEIQKIFTRVMGGRPVAPQAALQFKSAMLYEFGVMDWEKGWVQQFHLGALRNTNTRLRRTLGPDSGFDSIGDFEVARPLARFLDRLDGDDKLARTILYNLNPRDNEALATMAGNFQDGSVPGKIQYGPAWWFLDQIDGMTKQLEALSNMGLLSQFIGMTTDSRSFLSYSRHEYFRRLLCNILGGEMERGLLPDDLDLVGGVVRDICYFNAERYFRFLEPDR